MVMFKKLFLIVGMVMSAMHSDAMWLCRPTVNGLARRATTLRVSAIKPAVCLQTVCSKSVIPHAKQQQTVMKRRINVLQSTTPKASYKHHNSPKSFNASSIKRLVGAGVVLGAVCATAQEASCEGDKAKDETPGAVYQGPFEESRKKFYKDLENKPWGEVSKKYIKALQEEEQKLMEEFFEITKITKDEWNAALHKYRDQFEKECASMNQTLKDRYSADVPDSLQKNLDSVAIDCAISSDRLKYLELGPSWVVFAAIDSSIYITSQVMSHYGAPEYSHWRWKLPYEDGFMHWIMKHEMQHILHSDAYVGYTLNKMRSCNELSTNEKKYDNYLTVLNAPWDDLSGRMFRFAEKRADILALLSMRLDDHPSQVINKPSLDGVKKSSSTDTHPSFEERCVYLHQLHKEMTEAPSDLEHSFPLYV